jgi:hypothetical protein
MTSGKLRVHILEANLTRDTEAFGKMDPYVIICTRMQRVRTKEMKNAGKHPVWTGEVMDIDVKYVGDDMTLQVFDQDVGSSDIIGQATIKLSSLCIGTGMDDWFEIQYKGKKAGSVHLKSEWQPSGAALAAMPTAPMPPPVVTYTNGQQAVHVVKAPEAMPQYYSQQPPMQQQPPQQQMGYPQQQQMPPQQQMGYPPQQQQMGYPPQQ